MPVSVDDLNKSTTPCFTSFLDKEKITAPFLAKQLKRELRAKETKIVKVKVNVKADEVLNQIVNQLSPEDSPKKKISHIKILYQTSEEAVVAIDFINWTTRQTARMDAHKLRGDYKPLNVKVNGKLDFNIDDAVRKLADGIAAIAKRRGSG